MIVDQQGARAAADLRVYDRRAAGGNLPRRCADPLQTLLHESGHGDHALTGGGHAGLRNKRFQIVDEALDLSPGLFIFLLVTAAVVMFWIAELAEKRFARPDITDEI